MTRIRLYHDRKGLLCGFSVVGHAGMGPEGEDIACAAVSALAITAANAIESVAGVEPISHIWDGFLSVRLPKGLARPARHTARIILRTARQGFSDIAKAYPQYVRISQGL